jgi:hypothetical protein
MAGQHANMAQPNHATHAMAAAEYLGGHHLPTDQDYRQNPNIYAGQVPSAPPAPYGQAQAPASMYGEMEGMYPYSAMQAQQVGRSPFSLNQVRANLPRIQGAYVIGGI